jgi:hypothetical protein
VTEDEGALADHPPKIFVSYRWSSPDHEEWVLRLATSLRASGIDVKLDKWHLKEGQDTLAFMESMVNDETITKVLLICDSGYVERANSREGGVGTEAQIVSAKVYNDTNQDKFAAIVVELDELGAPLLPTYMSTRLYFDMSSIDAEATNYEKLVRWIFNQPFHALPPIGENPNFLGKTYATGSPLFKVGSAATTPTGVRLASTESAEGVLRSIAEESKTFHMQLVDDPQAAEKVYSSIKEIRPVAENAYRALRQIISSSSGSASDTVHTFFESLMKNWDRSPVGVRYSRWDNDVYQYFVHDLFVSFVAISMELRSFDLASEILSMPFFKPRAHDQTGEAADYTEFRPYAESLDNFGQARRRISLHADILNEAHEHSIVGQTVFMEADLTLHLRGILAPKLNWYPISALYLAGTYGALPTYVRAKSKRFYERLKPLLLNTEAEAIRSLLADRTSKKEGLRFDYRTLDIARLIAAPELATSA